MSSAINADLPTKTFNPEDASLLEVFFEHNQATPEVFLSIQEAADRRMGLASANDEDNDRAEPALSVRPFAKREKGVDFYVILTISLILFPQFKGVKQPGVLRASGRKGRLSLNPYHTPSSLDDGEGNSHVLFNNIPDPAGRYWTLKTNIANRSYEMAIPPVFEANGRRVHPTQYKSVTPEGTIDAIGSLMKVYNIIDKGNTNCPCTFVFDRVQVITDKMVPGTLIPESDLMAPQSQAHLSGFSVQIV